jgi:tetratricopeptide (TPR) repeat protein/DNA-binding CsgD family transcriptional regulator
MKKSFVLIFLLTFSVFWSQNKKNYKTFYNAFSKHQFSNPNLSKKYLDSILQINKLTDSLVSKTYNDVGIYYAITSDYERAIQFFKKALNSDLNITTKTKANVLCNIGNTQKMKGEFDYAIQNYSNAGKLYKLDGDQKNIFKVESELSAVYYAMSDFNKALEISSNLLIKLEDFNDEKLLNIQRLRHANILFNLANYNEAILEYKKTISYFSKDIDNNLQNKYVVLMNIGECYSELKNPKALDYFTISLEGFKKITDVRNENLCLSRIGKHYYRNKDLKKAKPFLENSFLFMYQNLPHLCTEIYIYYLKNLIELKLFTEIDKLLNLDQNIILSNANLQEKIFYYKTLASIKNFKKKYDEEYVILKKLELLYEEREGSNSFEEIQKKLNQYNIKSEIEKNKILSLKLQNIKLQRFFALSIFLFLFVFSYYVYDTNKKKRKFLELRLMFLENEKELQKNNTFLIGEKLKMESELLKVKERELTALQLNTFKIKNQVLDFINSNVLLSDTKKNEALVKKISRLFDNQDNWREFQLKFTKMHPDFFKNIQTDFPNLTKKDIDFLILVKLNLSNKEISNLIAISYESVITKKYLIRKKMSLSSDNELFKYLDLF